MQCLTYGSSCTEVKEISQASSNNWTNKLPIMVVIYALIETIKQTVNVITDIAMQIKIPYQHLYL